MRLLGISGSLRRGAYTTALLRAAGEALLDDVDFVVFDGLKAVPPYDQDDDVEPAPPAVARLRAAIAGADAVLFATPEYNGSIPGVLKNAVDWASRPVAASVLRNKPVAVAGATTGIFGAVWAQAELRKVLATCGARVLDDELPIPRVNTLLDEHGRLLDDDVRARLVEVAYALVGEAVPLPAAA